MSSPGGFVRSSGEGWWSTERVPQPSSDAAAADDDWDIESFFDTSVLLNPNFLIVCAAVALTQIIVGVWLIRDGLKLDPRPSVVKTKSKKAFAPKPPLAALDQKVKTT